MPDIPADSLERLLAGELSRADERRLAQASLHDPELFDALTAAAIAKGALARPANAPSDSALAPDAVVDHAATGRPAWLPKTLVAGLAAAAALVLVVAYGWKSSAPVPSRPATSSPVILAPVPAAPVLLSARMETAAAPTFRAGDTPLGRPARQAGTILHVSGGTADIDLGSLDGLAQGLALPIVRGSRRLDRLIVTAVFRERARGRIDARAGAQPGDRVEVDRATHTRALLEQVAARRARGDLTAATRLASLAVSTANDQSVPSDIRRRSLTELGSLERWRGSLDDAVRLLQEAVGTFDAAPAATLSERVQILNELGVIQIEKRDFAAAERTLQLAQPMASGPAGVHVSNNLGALAALRGDRAAAERFYRAAASLAAGLPNLESDRQAVAKNLASVRPSP